MPVVFFVSGALVRKTLRTVDGARRSAITYWRNTFRRLLVPYWTYYAVVVAYCAVHDLHHESSWWSLRWDDVLLGATGLVIPDASSSMRQFTGHLWFMSAFLVLTLAAPALVRIYERIGMLVMLIPLGVFAFVEWRIAQGVPLRKEVDKVATFGVAYVAGFPYTDRWFQRLPRWVFAVAAAGFGVAARWYDGVRPGAVNASGIKHLLVGFAWFAVMLTFAPQLRAFAERHRPALDAVSERTFTIFLWGWTTSVLAWDVTSDLTSEEFHGIWVQRGVYAVLAMAFLGIAVWLFGWVEDVAARRPARLPFGLTFDLPLLQPEK